MRVEGDGSTWFRGGTVDEDRSREEAGDRDASSHVGMGALIGIGAGIGLIFGTMLDNLALGLAAGAAIGTVIGAVVESQRRR